MSVNSEKIFDSKVNIHHSWTITGTPYDKLICPIPPGVPHQETVEIIDLNLPDKAEKYQSVLVDLSIDGKVDDYYYIYTNNRLVDSSLVGEYTSIPVWMSTCDVNHVIRKNFNLKTLDISDTDGNLRIDFFSHGGPYGAVIYSLKVTVYTVSK